jgi:hypothetical protein
MTSRTYSRPNGLSENQLNAVEFVLAGSSDTQTAQRISIARETVTRWRNYDPFFKAEVERRRRELWSTTLNALRATLPQAMDTLRDQLRVGPNRGRLALDLLHRAGINGRLDSVELDMPPPEPTPEDWAVWEHYSKLIAEDEAAAGRDPAGAV